MDSRTISKAFPFPFDTYLPVTVLTYIWFFIFWKTHPSIAMASLILFAAISLFFILLSIVTERKAAGVMLRILIFFTTCAPLLAVIGYRHKF